MIEPLQQLLAADILRGMGERPLVELRDLRVRCSQVEGDISLVRRLAQGRLDIIGHEVRRRTLDTPEARPDTTVLFDLPDLMADPKSPAGTARGRPVSVGDPGPVAFELVGRLDAIASPAQLGSASELSDAELRELLETIRSFELELSAVRRQLHERIDAIQSEIGRRYRDGEASVDGLLG